MTPKRHPPRAIVRLLRESGKGLVHPSCLWRICEPDQNGSHHRSFISKLGRHFSFRVRLKGIMNFRQCHREHASFWRSDHCGKFRTCDSKCGGFIQHHGLTAPHSNALAASWRCVASGGEAGVFGPRDEVFGRFPSSHRRAYRRWGPWPAQRGIAAAFQRQFALGEDGYV